MNKFNSKIREDYLLYLGSNTILYFIHNFVLYKQKLERNCKSIDQKKNTPANRQELARIKKHLKKLRELFYQARCKPLLTKYRDKNWFFLLHMNTRCFVHHIFVPAEIIVKRQCGKEISLLTVAYKDIIILERGTDECNNYSLCSPLIMQEWEYQYFKKHPNFAKDWIKASSADEKTVKDFLTALDY